MPPAAAVAGPVALMGRTQAVWSMILAVIPNLYLFLAGCFLFVAPSHWLELLFSCFHNDQFVDGINLGDSNSSGSSSTPLHEVLLHVLLSLDLRMSRLVGSVLIGQVLSCTALLYPLLAEIGQPTTTASTTASTSTGTNTSLNHHRVALFMVAGNPKDAATLDKFRSAVASLAIMGLLLLVAGLVDDRTHDDNYYYSYPPNSHHFYDDANDNYHAATAVLMGGLSCATQQSTVVIASGALTLIFACASMMISFWPQTVTTTAASSTTEEGYYQPANSRRTNQNHIPSVRNNINSQDREALTPLLSSANSDNDTNDSDEIHENVEAGEAQPITISTGESSNTVSNQPNTGNCNDQENSTIVTSTTQSANNVDNEDDANNNNNNNNDDDNSNEPTSRIRGTTRLLKLAAPQVFYLYVGCAVLLVRLPFSLSIPHFVSTTLGAVSRGDFAGARMEILLLFILGTIDAALDFWCIFLFGYANQKIVRGVRIDTFLSILRQEVAFFDKTTSGDLASRLSSDCTEMAGDLTWFFRFSIESIVRITGIVSYMLLRCPTLGVCAMTIIPLVAFVNKLYGNWLNKNAKEVQDALAAANEVSQECFSCIRTVIAFASEQQEYNKYKEKIDHQYKLNVRQLYMTGIYYMMISTFLINTVVQATLLLIGTSLIEHGKLTSEILLAFMLYQGQLQNETMNLFQSYTSLVKSSGAGDKVFSLLDRRPLPPGTGSPEVIASEIIESAQQVGGENSTNDAYIPPAREGDSATPFSGHKKSACSVEIKDVNFTYPCRAHNTVLSGFNLDIPQGKTVALVGASGCGKSTVVGLLQRFYDPISGSILIDGQDLKTLDVKQHRRRIGVVTQDPILFKGTILSNITYGCPSATRADAIEAARLANALDFVNSFPNGFETDVGERGVQLSGGQKQRIAIARAIVKRKDLLLLDEATSALDAESEQAVQDALDTLLKTNQDMTTLIVAHRLRTVRNADMIVFIENGKVVEKGTHEDLVQIPSGHYRRMVERAGRDGQLPDR